MGDTFEIRVSSNLVNQLADNEEKLKRARKPKPKMPQGRENVQRKVPQKQASDGSESHKSVPNAGWPPQPPLFLPISPPPSQVAIAELDAIRSVLQDSEAAVERLQKQEENMVQEVTRRAKELHDKEFKLPLQKPMPCLSEKEACFECYRNHVKDPLKCADVVEKFAECARIARQQVNSIDG